MGLESGLVVVKRNNQGIEIAPKSTKSRRKVRVSLPPNAPSHNAPGPTPLICLFRRGLANSKYHLRTPKLDASCCNHLAPSRRWLAAIRVTPGKMVGTSSVLQANLPNRDLLAKIRP